MARSPILLATVLSATLVSTVARAQSEQAHAQDVASTPPDVVTTPPANGEPSPKRRLPDYEGRPPVADPDDGVGLWLLRILLSPLYFTSELILRRPIGAMTIAAERAEIPRKLYNFFVFGPDHKLGFVPAAFIEFGFNPSVGIYGWWNDAFTLPNNDLQLHYEVWPTDWLAGSITERIYFHEREHSLLLRVSGVRRPDRVFYGLGPRSLQSSESRYTVTSFDARASLDMHVWRSSRVETTVGLRKLGTSPGDYAPDPSLEQAAAAGVFALPYGFNQNYLDPYGRVRAAFDTRRENATTGSGVRLEVWGEEGNDVAHSPTSSWVRWGGDATVFVDLNDHGRILSLSAAALFADPLGNQPIPFTELVMLGGDVWMRGYFEGRLLDRSAVVAQLRYGWPVAPWLNGTIQGAVGNVFGEHLTDFKPGLLRVSAAIGLSTTINPPIELLAGFGSEPFEDGATIDSFRLSFGVPLSF